MEISRVAGEALEKTGNLWFAVAPEDLALYFPLISRETSSMRLVGDSLCQADVVEVSGHSHRALLCVIHAMFAGFNDKGLLTVSASN